MHRPLIPAFTKQSQTAYLKTKNPTNKCVCVWVGVYAYIHTDILLYYQKFQDFSFHFLLSKDILRLVAVFYKLPNQHDCGDTVIYKIQKYIFQFIDAVKNSKDMKYICSHSSIQDTQAHGFILQIKARQKTSNSHFQVTTSLKSKAQDSFLTTEHAGADST